MINSLPFVSLNFINLAEQNNKETSDLTGITSNFLEKSISSTVVSSNKPLNNAVSNEFVENVLLISEIKNKIVLPYTFKELDEFINLYPEKYANYNEVINDKYTLPYNSFSSSPMSRFKEAFKLVKRNKGSVFEAFDLGYELAFNYNLNTAIICACKNVDELDIYLDYLENNETDKFDIFEIKYEFYPTV